MPTPCLVHFKVAFRVGLKKKPNKQTNKQKKDANRDKAGCPLTAGNVTRLTPHDLDWMLMSVRSLWVWEPVSQSSSSPRAPGTSCPRPPPFLSTPLCPAGTRTSRCPSRPSRVSVWCSAPPLGGHPAHRAQCILTAPQPPRGSVPVTRECRSPTAPPPPPRMILHNCLTHERRLRCLEDSRSKVEEGWEGGLLPPHSQGACSLSRSLKWKEKGVRSDT